MLLHSTTPATITTTQIHDCSGARCNPNLNCTPLAAPPRTEASLPLHAVKSRLTKPLHVRLSLTNPKASMQPLCPSQTPHSTPLKWCIHTGLSWITIPISRCTVNSQTAHASGDLRCPARITKVGVLHPDSLRTYTTYGNRSSCPLTYTSALACMLVCPPAQPSSEPPSSHAGLTSNCLCQNPNAATNKQHMGYLPITHQLSWRGIVMPPQALPEQPHR